MSLYECRPGSKHKPATAKQRQLLELLAAGLALKEAARVLGLNHSTVTRRVIHLRSKYDAANTTHLIAKCLRAGLIA